MCMYSVYALYILNVFSFSIITINHFLSDVCKNIPVFYVSFLIRFLSKMGFYIIHEKRLFRKLGQDQYTFFNKQSMI